MLILCIDGIIYWNLLLLDIRETQHGLQWASVLSDWQWLHLVVFLEFSFLFGTVIYTILCSLTEFYVKLAVVFKALFFHGGTSSLFGTWEWCHYRILRRHMVFVSKELETFLIKMASKHRSFHTVIHIFIERVSFREIVY